jgi:hypothetical protein
MTNYSKRVFEMLVKVLVFRSTHGDLIAKDSELSRLLDDVEAAAKTISEQSKHQASGKNDVRISTAERDKARATLRATLETVSRTAASIGLAQFYLPQDRSDRSLASVGRIFLELAEPLASEFVARHVPPDFIERLRTAIARIEESIEQQAASKGARMAATKAIAEAQAGALAALSRIDPIITNLLSDNEPAKAVWEAARRIERVSAAKKIPPPEPPVSSPDTAAASKAA